jgi:hypothetical protein
MRAILTYAMMVTMLAAAAQAQESPPSAKEPITDEMIVNTCGGRLAMMFALYGTPQDVWADRGATEDEDDVYLGYGAYGFKVRDRMVRVCFFFKGWEGPIRGIKIGDSREDVVRILGSPRMTVTNKDGVVTAYGYELNNLDANFFANFHEDGKVWRVEVSSK